MRLVFIIACLGMCVVFYRTDVQLLSWVPSTFNVLIVVSLALILGCGLVLFRARRQSWPRAAHMLGWLMIIFGILSIAERPFEPISSGPLVANQSQDLEPLKRTNLTAHVVTAKDGLFAVTARSGTTEFDAMLDTGATKVLLTFDTAQKLGLEPVRLDFQTLVNTAAGQAKIAEVILPALEVGNLRVENVAAAISAQGVEHQNLLGSSFLSKLSSVEFRADRAVMTQRVE